MDVSDFSTSQNNQHEIVVAVEVFFSRAGHVLDWRTQTTCLAQLNRVQARTISTGDAIDLTDVQLVRYRSGASSEIEQGEHPPVVILNCTLR